MSGRRDIHGGKKNQKAGGKRKKGGCETTSAAPGVEAATNKCCETRATELDLFDSDSLCVFSVSAARDASLTSEVF